MKFDDRPVSQVVADMFEDDWKKKQSIDKEDFAIAEIEHDKMHERLDTIDALVWTNEFMKIRYEKLRKENSDIAADEGTMIAWFANAIMKGYDNGCRVGEKNGYAVAVKKKDQSEAMELHAEIDELHNRFNRIYEEAGKVVDVQSQNGNWNFDPYMHGMLNGMILIQAIIHDVEPEYADAPEEWLQEDPKQWLNDKTKIEDDNYDKAMALVSK
jgi:hypothetical protein